MLVTSLNRRQPSNLQEKRGPALCRKASTRSTSCAHAPTSPREPLLESKEAAKGRPQSKHCCFASVIPFPFISLECFPEASEYHTLPTSWETGAGKEGNLPRSWGPAAALHPPACILFGKAHICLPHEVPRQEGPTLLLFPLSLGVSHGTAAGLSDERALAHSSCCWHQSSKSWLAPAVAGSLGGLSPMTQVPAIWRSQTQGWQI